MKFKIIKNSTGESVSSYMEGIYFHPDTGQFYRGSMNVTDQYELHEIGLPTSDQCEHFQRMECDCVDGYCHAGEEIRG